MRLSSVIRYPLSLLYGLGVAVRNLLFDHGWLRSKRFGVPTICVGNLAVGGTGKTPHTEYLIRLLLDEGLCVAVLSRGYRRHTHGFVLVTPESTPSEAGDEPCQMKRKYPAAWVAVDEKRCHGIEQLLSLQSAPQVVLLDDAFQHRYVQAGLSILLTDYHRLFCDDRLLPMGRLREPERGKLRADVVVVTKCPADIKPIDFNITAKRLGLLPCQQLFFTGLTYGRLYPIDNPQALRDLPSADEHVICLTGIAQPAPLLDELRRHTPHVDHLAFPDHHAYTGRDLHQLRRAFDQLPTDAGRLIVTTEKDAVRLADALPTADPLRPYIHVLPITVSVLQNKQSMFNQHILHHVRTHSTNG